MAVSAVTYGRGHLRRRGGKRNGMTGLRTVGVVGAGKVGTVLARLSAAAGFRTLVAGSAAHRGILDLVLGVTAPGAAPAGIEQIAGDADLIILVVQFRKSIDLPYRLFADRVVVDAMNYWPPIDGSLPE